MRIASLSTVLPSQDQPHHGIFVQRRLEAMAGLTDLRALKLLPWFPILKPLAAPAPPTEGLEVIPRRMPYIPGVLKWLDGRWFERAVMPPLRSWQQDGGLNVIDAHFGYPEGVGAYRAGRRLGVPVFITMRGSEQYNFRTPGIREQVLEALSECAGVVSVSHALKATAVANGVPEDQIRVIPNAIDSDLFRTGDRLAARRELGVPADQPLIVSVGQLARNKRHHVLIEALAEVRRELPNAELAIVGGSTLEVAYKPGELQAVAERCGVSDAVRFVGKVPPTQIPVWLRAANVFGLLSAEEGCCNAVLEALACGVPVVATGAGDNAVYVDAPRNGRIVPVDDAQQTAAALLEVLHADWDPASISQSLPAGGWPGVAERVLQFFRDKTGSTAHA